MSRNSKVKTQLKINSLCIIYIELTIIERNKVSFVNFGESDMMKLKRFRVTDFRSVDDSNWIETDNVTALIGTNESGKTNVLLPLWKLNPAKEGEIIPTADYPRKKYNIIRHQDPKPVFIQAVFEVDDELATEISRRTGVNKDLLREVDIKRQFNGEYKVDFPFFVIPTCIDKIRVQEIFEEAEEEINAITPQKSEENISQLILTTLKTITSQIVNEPNINLDILNDISSTLDNVKTEHPSKSSLLLPRYQLLKQSINSLKEEISREHPRDNEDIKELVLKNLPKFVYYSTYGNLDSEIYLPHVISNLSRLDLGLKEQAKARTLKVLFEFVRLKPQEILELGRDFKETNRQPTEAEISEIAEKKKQRSILLQSASTLLTREFRDWWKQGEYRFRFEADGEHFRIWVSDDKRPEEIELEGRSTGLQWFLSFYLVFLVERSDAHSGAILLLDEPGLSLHPMAQRDLSTFFNSLSTDNQLIYTCHSPFLVDADRLDRVRKVYVDSDGTSKVTSDLRISSEDNGQKGAAYAVFAALGLSIAESLLIGCEPVIVEGSSDQHYLTAIKIILIQSGKVKISREIIFPPAGGAKGVKVVASIIGGRDEKLPVALFDSDHPGNTIAQELRKGLYVDEPNLVLQIESFTGMAGSEIEDLIPAAIIIRELDRWLRSATVPFADEYIGGKPIVPQIEEWAKRYQIQLQNPGWKVELSKRVKNRLLEIGDNEIEESTLSLWSNLFQAIQNRGLDSLS